MKILGLVLALVAVVGAVGVYRMFFADHSANLEPVKAASVLEFTMKNIDGQDIRLDKYKGNVLLIVNTASKCGYTPQYEGLENIYKKYNSEGFYVLGFPANNFMGQEPGTNEEIKDFCTLKYKTTFPMFAKISVKGDDIDPLYNFLTNPKTDPQFSGDIKWNFNKFLIDRKGNVVARFDSKATPESEEVTKAIEKYMAAK